MFYDASVVDGGGEDEGDQALREAQDASHEACVFLVDANRSMVDRRLPSGQTPMGCVLNCLENFLKSKVIASPNDRVAVVLYGTEGHRNEYGLEHVHVVRGLGNLTARYIKEVAEELGGVDALAYEGGRDHRGLSLKLALWTCSHMLKEFSKK